MIATSEGRFKVAISASGVVLEQQPAYATKVGTDVLVEIYINRYVEEEPETENSDYFQ